MDKRKARLMLVQALINIALPIFAVVYFVNQAPAYGLEDLRGGAAYSLLLIVFIAFMQIVSATELYADLNVRRLLMGLTLPFIYMGFSVAFSDVGLGWYLFEMGALYSMAITLAYLFLVFLRPIVSGVLFSFSAKEALGYLGAALAQLFFIGPGLLLGWLYIQLLLANTLADFVLGRDWWRLAVFVVTLVQLAHHEYYWMHKGSPDPSLISL